MTAERLHSAAQTPESNETLISPETFITNLYSETLSWLTDEIGAKVVIRFNADINADDKAEWGDLDRIMEEDYFELKEAVILENDRYDYALVLGYRHCRSGPTVTFKAGYDSHIDDFKRKDLWLHRLTNPYLNNATVNVHVPPLWGQRLYIEGWANSISNGGKEIGDSWEGSIRTKEGFAETMVMIKDTLTRGHRNPNLR